MSKSSFWQSKIKDIFNYTLLVGMGLGVGLGTKYSWDWYNTAPEYIELDTTAHFINVSEKIVIYTTQWCLYCTKAKEYLTANDIAFTERDIEKGNKENDVLFQSIGYSGIPKIVIGNVIINGFNQPILKKELEKNQLI